MEFPEKANPFRQISGGSRWRWGCRGLGMSTRELFWGAGRLTEMV